MTTITRMFLFALFIALLWAAPSAFAVDSCNECTSIHFNDGTNHIYCDRPDPGVWGTRNCTVWYYPEGAYCEQWGDPCCIDPRMG